MSDEVILEIKDRPLKCSRQQLIDNSDYFKVMFEGNLTKSQQETIKLKEVNLDAMKIVISLLTDRDYIIRQEDLYSVLQAVCRLQFLSLKSILIERLYEFLNYDTCLKTWICCEELNIKPLYVHAKTLSLMEFSHIKNGNSLAELTHTQLCMYLGNRTLRCQSELTVFEAAMKWWYENCTNYDLSEHRKLLIRLLYCLDFSNVTISDIKEMQLYPDLVESQVIEQILECVVDHKNFGSLLGFGIKQNAFPENIQHIAKRLLSSKPRNPLEYPCIIVENIPPDVHVDRPSASQTPGFENRRQSLLYFDLRTGNAEKLVELRPCEINGLEGFKVIGYKELIFIFGGEHTIGQGSWNNNFSVFDTFKEIWLTRTVLPYARRNFECCICKDDIYIVGGSGAFGVSKDTMFVYNYKTDKWTEEISLPCTALQLKCFNYKNSLFLLSICNRYAYIYDSPTQVWQNISLADVDLPMFSGGLSVFAINDSIYLKGRNLLEFRIENIKMHLVRETFLEILPYDQMESALSDNILYTIYKRHDPIKNNTIISFEKFNVSTNQISSFWDDVNYSKYIRVSGNSYLCSERLCIFTFQHFSVNETTELVNEFINNMYNPFRSHP